MMYEEGVGWDVLRSCLKINRRILKEIAKKENCTFSRLVCMMRDEQIEKHQKSTLDDAAQALLVDYTTDKDLTTFMCLDSEGFNA